MPPITIPVQIDSLPAATANAAADDASRGARCIYYRVEVEDGLVLKRARWLAGARAAFAAGVSWAVLTGPETMAGGAPARFTSPALITAAMDAVHAGGLSLEIGYLWVPGGMLAESFPGEAVREGDVYRLSAPYFLHAYRFVTERISEDEWLLPHRRFIRPVTPSPEETLAFRAWRREQIEASKARYHEPEFAPFRLAKKVRSL